ncbi:MAG TPA: hypothetical protein VL490_01430 [Mucilaginibacter sp.]|jgi:hypothetical protein|nr:hypothetical protein [Mucilaginibacter sp.]
MSYKKIFLSVVILGCCNSGFSQNRGFDAILRNLNSKISANNFNAQSDVDVITYKSSTTIPYIENINIQKKFILSSGFPLVNPGFDNTHTMPKTFEEADLRYRNFKAKEINNQYLDVFIQDAACLIIRGYLLGQTSKSGPLRYYTEELLQSHTQNYGLLYLAFKQLKPVVGEKKINEYKSILHSDVINKSQDKALNNMQVELNRQSKNNDSSHFTKTQEITLKSLNLSQRRQEYYIQKIDSL